jgi:PAS domain S-box-containing protein
MNLSSVMGAGWARGPQLLSDNKGILLCRACREGVDGKAEVVLAVLPAAEHPTPQSLDPLTHEYQLKDELDGTWAAKPLELVQDAARTILVLEDLGGEPLTWLIGAPMEIGCFLRLAIQIAAALAQVHQRSLVHKDIKPANILVNRTNGKVRLTGFGLASRYPRERQSPAPPESIAGTLAYMAPEQTGRMNRSIDSRSDLYSLGVTLYQMLTGSLPFTASDLMELVHCHLARQPVPPSERVKSVPVPVSAIVMKLLAKTAEDRYQTAAGLERDLRCCLEEWEASSRLDDFRLGEHDTPDRLLIPEKLYGRAREVEILLASFDRTVKTGAPELMLVSGYSGVGKSSVVNELHKALVPPRGLFASGKFDQYKRDIPYATLVQAFQSLVQPLLSKSDAELAIWREALLETLGPNGALIVDLVPELKLIIGEQPPVPELPPQQAQIRFQLVFRRFIGVFARPEHPLALFLDDLQWLDAATLELLQDLLTQPDLRHLMMIGAYRDNEVDATHPLTRKLEAIKNAGGKIEEITLAPLAREHIEQLIADALRREPERAAPLAQLVHDKTAGNPFFVIQFLDALADEGLLFFDHNVGRWSWDLHRIHAKGYTDNVVDLMVGKLSRLPAETQRALQQLACLGNTAEITLLSTGLGASPAQLHADLREAVRLELVEQLAASYKFVHDRVQEAAYSQIPEASRAETHLRIGRLLAAQTPPEKRQEVIFEIVNQLNRGAPLITSSDERERLAELNLIAGKRAQAASAYSSGLAYFAAGAALLTDDCWRRRYELAFELEFNRAKCEYLTGAPAAAEMRLTSLSGRVGGIVEQAAVTCLRMEVYVALDLGSRAVDVALDYLARVGIAWSPHPSDEEARREYEHVRSQVGNRTIEELVALPLMDDRASLATMDVLATLMVPALFTDANLYYVAASRSVNLSLERGYSDGSCPQFECLGLAAATHFGDSDGGFRLGEVGYELVERRGLNRFQAKTYTLFGAGLLPWGRHVRAGRDVLRRALEAASRTGDLTYVSFGYFSLTANLLAAGDPLIEVQRAAEMGLQVAQKSSTGSIVDMLAAPLALVRTLRGLTHRFGCFDDEQFAESQIEGRFAAAAGQASTAECIYLIRKLQARFFAGDSKSALEARAKAEPLIWTMAMFELAEYDLYGALACAASCESASAAEAAQLLDAIVAHHGRLHAWAKSCPENFDNRATLVGAEIARLQGRALDAEQLYEDAIRSARANGFVHNEALANELAGRFYAARGFEKTAHAYLRDAHHGYLRWGADPKVRQLERLYPLLHIADDGAAVGTMSEQVQQMDVTTVVKASQAISSEMELPRLIETLMKIALQNAGADRGLLILSRHNDVWIEAEGRSSADEFVVVTCQAPVSGPDCPEALLRYVLRTQKTLIVDDASHSGPLCDEAYVDRRHPRSILCLPLMKQAKLAGLLYLENSLATHAFTPKRVAVLELLAAQAAISLENTLLYRDLWEREARIRRLVDSNIIGILFWDGHGNISYANDAFLSMTGYARQELVSGAVGWNDMTPAEHQLEDAQRVDQLRLSGQLPPRETELFRKDRSRIPVLIGSALLTESSDQAISFVLDLTERKQAETEARESERRYQDMQLELAHANRVATMGHLTSSIAHEVNQPISAIAINAGAALSWLARTPPDVDKVRISIEQMAEDAHRGGEVIGRIRELFKKAPPRKGRLDLNEAVREVIVLTESEALKNRISVKTQLVDGLSLIKGDRVQLQQVLLNLVVNAVQTMATIPDGARDLLITTAPAGSDCVLVQVADFGPGLDPQTLERVFDPYYTTKPEGLGMGLAICRSIIDAHNGRLWASANLPRGAVFQFTLPADPDGGG